MTWDPFGYGAQLAAIQKTLNLLVQKVNTIMSEDAAIAGMTTQETADVAVLTSALQSLAATFTALLAEAQANGGNVTPETIAAAQAELQQLDAITAAATSQASSEAAEVPAPPPAPAAG